MTAHRLRSTCDASGNHAEPVSRQNWGLVSIEHRSRRLDEMLHAAEAGLEPMDGNEPIAAVCAD